MRDEMHLATAVAALRHAAPYLKLFRGKTFVIKAGGGALADEARAAALVEQLAVLAGVGIRVVLVHGGGEQTSALTRALGGEPVMVAGRRVTDPAALEAATMVLNGSVSTRLLALCRRAGIPAVGLSGLAGGLVSCRRRPPVEVDGRLVDYGQVGDIVSVDARLLVELLASGFVPVVSPLSAAADGSVLNVNADSVAAALAVALGAEKLLFLTGAAGILEREGDAGSLVSYTDLAGLSRLREAGALARGMLPKTAAIEQAIRGGVGRVHILSDARPDGLLAEIFTNEGVGTLVVASIGSLTAEELAPEEMTPEEQAAAESGR